MAKSWGARTEYGIEVIVNVYDLSPVNQYTHGFGLGFYHSGVEINGREYTYVS